MLRQILMMRDDKRIGEDEIERKLGLQRGLVARLGKRGVVGDVRIAEREERGAMGQ